MRTKVTRSATVSAAALLTLLLVPSLAFGQGAPGQIVVPVFNNGTAYVPISSGNPLPTTGSGGGGGAVTIASGGVASGAYSSGSIASGAYASGSISSGAFASGSISSGADVTEGTPTDAPCSLPATGTSCTMVAISKAVANAVNSAIPAGTALIGTVGITFPAGATPIQASATGTTGATTATLASGGGSITTYICGFSIRANAAAAATGNATVTGVSTTMNFTQWTAPNASGLGVTEMIFEPCQPGSAVATAINVVSAAPGTSGVVSVSAWGYQK